MAFRELLVRIDASETGRLCGWAPDSGLGNPEPRQPMGLAGEFCTVFQFVA